MPRLSDLSGNVSSAEQMLQEINQRLQSAESTLGEGNGGGVGSLPNNQFNVDPMSGPLQPALQQPNGQNMFSSNNTPRYSSFEEMMKNRIQSDIPSSFTNLEGVRSNPDGTPYTPPDNNQILSLMTNQTPGGPMQSPLQPGGLMQLQGSSGIPAAGYADGGNVVGGEYDFDSARQMYGLGKLVKKVTRSVKKIAKSPIGKAALLYTGLGGLGSLAQGGSFFTNFANPLSQIKSVGSIFAKGGLDNIMARTGLGEFVQAGPGKAVLEKNFLGKVLTSPTALISAGSAIAGLLTPEQESEAQKIADETGIDIAEIRANPDKYLARRFRAEGGSMDEPVAKKTMPLLDMDGQEMDLRAEGGFVPIGRMEKADDVPARLSKNEFVFTAEAVRNAGEGDVDKGAEVMYNMMKNLESGGEVSEESQGLEGAREMFQTSQRLEEVI